MRKALFSKALSGQTGLHFAAHSHHLWPDASLSGQQEYWEDSARLADRKWDRIFSEIIPAVQGHIARHLSLSDPAAIAFAPNTHALVNRLLSCLPDRPKILTSDSEFHSFSRQIARLEEDGLVQVERIPTLPFDSFAERFSSAAEKAHYDIVFFSQVFFNSGFAVPGLEKIVAAVKDAATLIVIDGYHGFMALPTNLSALENRVFYLAGGYKYAMAGEGCCFMHCPPGYGARPRDTGWFADMGALEHYDGSVNYAADGFRFWGATFDPSGLYRMKAVMEMLEREGLTVEKIHAHVLGLQSLFLSEAVHPGRLVAPADSCGHFLAFETAQAEQYYKMLKAQGVLTDYRGSRLRFGFGIYHDKDDVLALAGILAGCVKKAG